MLPVAEADAVERHASACGSCRSWIDAARAEDDLLVELRGARPERPATRPAGGPAIQAPGLERYRILRRIGEGGMGIVYEAEQLNPRRRVALKILRPALARAETLRRFELEARLLARLDHPGIARIFEASNYLSPDGPRPFFAMELVEGLPLRAAAAELPVPGRLSLFASVCDAVHHAHQKGVIHRDLKPGNVLVTSDGQPKVLDFGVARLHGDDQAAAEATLPGHVLGTLPYMSPEQVSRDAGGIDTRTDVHALGVILFELLAGRLPLDVSGLPIAEAARVIAEREPLRLSSVDPRFRGDLDWIAARALEKDPRRRYASAAELAADLRRHLLNEPVAARPPSAIDRVVKFGRRNPAFASALAAIAVLLAGAAVLSLTLLLRAREAETRAVERADAAERARLAAEDARRIAEDERQVAVGSQDLLLEVLIQARPGETPQNDPTIKEVVGAAAERVDGHLIENPKVEAAIALVLGEIETAWGRYPAADRYLSRAASLYEEHYGFDHSNVAVAKARLAMLRASQGRYAEAETLAREVLEARERIPGGRRRLIADVLSVLGKAQYASGRSREAVESMEQSLIAYRDFEGDDGVNVAMVHENLAVLCSSLGDRRKADELYAGALARMRRVFGERGARVASTLTNFGVHLLTSGRAGEAEAIVREALAIREERLGPEHPETATTLRVAADILIALRRPAEARPLLDRALAIHRRTHAPGHTALISTLCSLGDVLAADEASAAEARAFYAEAAQSATERYGEGHILARRARKGLAGLESRPVPAE